MCVWTEDADVIRWDEKRLGMVYENQKVKDYLRNNRKLGIAGTKGQGKTFLIKVKRARYQKKEWMDWDEDQNIICFPKNDMVDTIDNSISIDKSLHRFLSNYNNWVTLWKLSIAITILASEEFGTILCKNDKSKLKKETLDLFIIENKKRRPTTILRYLLKYDYNTLDIITEDLSLLINFLDRINSGVYIFIDKIDQAFAKYVYNAHQEKRGSRNASYWQYCQYGLANAAYDLISNVNVHIKVFYTIRHEALIDSELLAKNASRNIEAFLTELIYTKEDIREMFRLYVRNEDDTNLKMPQYKYDNQEKAFFGFEEIPHTYVNETEKIFDYLYRHTLRRPYDLMKICNTLFYIDAEKLTLDNVRNSINATSGKVLRQYFSEVEPFITCDYSDIEKLLSCLNTNIFDIKYIHYVCKRYNEVYGMKNVCNKDCKNCKNSHPFSTLYNIGILGYLFKTSANPICKQKFLPIGDSRLKLKEYDLPVSNLYILHPCLCDEARRIRNGLNREFIASNLLIACEGKVVPDETIKDIRRKRNIDKMKKEMVFVSSTISNLTLERKIAKEVLFDKGFYPIMSEEDNFGYAPNNSDSHDYCIDKLLKCSKMVCIIGKKIGGKYAGHKYKSYINEIYKKSGERIKEPSISLMEFFSGWKKGNIIFRVFIDEEISTDYEIYKKDKKNYCGETDIEVFTLVNFINHLEIEKGRRRGNWRMSYDSLDRLRTQISGIDFVK